VAAELTATSGDCNDADAAVHPGATEVCNGVDDDCDGQTDEGLTTAYYRDADGDGYGNLAVAVQACTPPDGYVADHTDCDDTDANEHPGQTWYKDADNDGYSDGTTSSACTRPAGYKVAAELTATSGDCDDAEAAVHPGATEVCNGVDDDCDGQTDEGLTTTYYQDADGDGYGDPNNSIQACAPPHGYVLDNTDCNDQDNSVHPGATEACNGNDDNCNGQVDEGFPQNTYYMDLDGDGYGDAQFMIQACAQPEGYVTNGDDCDDTKEAVHPGATETCNNIDDNCNGQVDEGLPQNTYYMDLDGDGYGDAQFMIQACAQPEGYVSNGDDCDDAHETVHPTAVEVCDNGLDDDCDGLIDHDDPDCDCLEQNIYHFKSGWNLITLACVPEEPYTAETLAQSINAAGGFVTKIMRWNNGAWETYSVGAPFGDFEIEIGQGYMVQAEMGSDWCNRCTGQGCVAYTLHSGWNLLGFPSADGLTASELVQICNDAGGNVTRILRWTGRAWRSYSAGAPFGDFTISPKEGYFLLSTVESTFSICPSSASRGRKITIQPEESETAGVGQGRDLERMMLNQIVYGQVDAATQAKIHFAETGAFWNRFKRLYKKLVSGIDSVIVDETQPTAPTEGRLVKDSLKLSKVR